MAAQSNLSKPHWPGLTSVPDLAERLRRQARRVTGPRQAIMRVLEHQRHPVAPKDIFLALGKGMCDLATVYRSLHLLEAMGIVKRFDLGDGLGRFELIREGDDGHHHHLICRSCAEVVELQDCGVGGLDEQIGRRNGFTAVTHRLEFFGLCPACQPQ